MSLLFTILNFCPTPHKVDDKKVKRGYQRFFSNSSCKQTPVKITQMNLSCPRTPQRNKSCTDPNVPGNHHRANVEHFCLTLMLDIEKLLINQYFVPHNPTKEEISSQKSQKNREDIVIKKADKGSTVVVLNKQAY